MRHFSALILIITTILISACVKQPKVEVSSFAKVGFEHSDNISQCNSCHGNDKTMGILLRLPINQFNHSYSGLPDCKVCHERQASNSNWSTWNIENIANGSTQTLNQLGNSHLIIKNPTSCITCHLAERPSSPAGTTAYDHLQKGAVGDCISCHGINSMDIGITWKIAMPL